MQIIGKGEYAPLDLCVFEKTGYSFKGWAIESGGAVSYTDGQVYFMGNAAVNLYARWSANIYAVQLDQQGGTGGTEEISVTYDLPLPSASQPERPGYIFNGYFSGPDGQETQYYNDSMASVQIWDIDSPVTLYASWTIIGYLVTLDQAGGAGGTESVTANYQTPMPAAEGPVHTGYTFHGYYSEEAGGGTQYYDSDMDGTRNWDILSDTTLHAWWTVNEYSVTLDQQGGTGGTVNITAVFDADMPEALSPARPGYIFTGYYTEPGGSGSLYYNPDMTSARIWDLDLAVTLYAGWTAIDYTVTLEQGIGSGGASSVITHYLQAMPVAAGPVKTGYTFHGYFAGVDGTGNQYYDSDMEGTRSWDLLSNTTLYAWWTVNDYSVSLDPQGGTGGTTGITATFDAAMPPAAAPTRTGYTFHGYYTGTNGSGTAYYDSSMNSLRIWDIDLAVTLYAYWTAIDYTLTLNQAGGSGGSESVTANYLFSMPSATAPVRTGYTFHGYCTRGGSGSGTQYYNSDMTSARVWDILSDTTLYAWWTVNDYSVTLDLQEGTGGTTGVTATFDAAMPSATAPTRTGYTFHGYYTGTGGSGTAYYDSVMTSLRSWDIDGNTTLYAYWTGNEYTITFDKDGGSGGTATADAVFGSPMPDATAPVYSGYSFAGYYTESDGAGTQYYSYAMESVTSWDITAATTLYAYWVENDYTVTLNGGSYGGTGSVTATFGDSMPAATAPTLPEGYTFTGYFEEYDIRGRGTGDQYYSAVMASVRNWDIPSDTTLYMGFDGNPYTVTFDQQGGAGGFPAIPVIYDEPLDSVSVPFRPGYTFQGYYTSAGGVGTQYWNEFGDSAGLDWNIASDTTLYAYWTANTYTVYFDQQSGSGGTTSTTGTYGQPMPAATAPTLFNNDFNGYFTETGGGGTQYYAADMGSMRTWDIDGPILLFAYWTIKEYTVTLHPQGGSGGTETVQVSYYCSMPPAVAPTMEGYRFLGYYDGSGGSGTQYYDGDMNSVNDWYLQSGGDLYADWEEILYAYFNKDGGTGGSDSVVVFTGEPMPAAEAPTREGYRFLGYYSDYNGSGTQYYDADMNSLNNWEYGGSNTLYADWLQVYTVTLDMYGGSGGTGEVTVAYGESMPAAIAPTLNGSVFMGYFTSTNGNGTRYYDENMNSVINWDQTNDDTLHAYWETSYTVTLDMDGGSGGTSTVTVGYDQPMPAAIAPTLSGSVFMGYFSGYDGDGTQYYDADMNSVNDWDQTNDDTLHAYWETGWTVDLYKDGGTGGTDSVIAAYGAPMPEATAPTREGYVFLGYYESYDGSGTQYYDADMNSVNNWDINGNDTIYAYWETGYTVTFNKDGGIGGTDSVIVAYGSPMPTATAPTQDGSVFMGYYGSSNGNGTQYYDAEMNSVNNWDYNYDRSIYAYWKTGYTVTFNKDGGIGGTDSVIAAYGSPMPEATAPTQDGYIFMGYYDSWNGSGSQYYDYDMKSLTVWDENWDGTLYAYWEDECTVTFDKEGGVGGTSSVSVAYGLPMPAASAPTKSGNVFLGYYENREGGGTQYYDSEMNSVNDWDSSNDDTIYAYWENEYQYTVTLNNDGGTGGSSSVTATYGLYMPSAIAPSRTGYVFLGYFENSNGSGTKYYDAYMNSANAWDRTSDYTLYAYWGNTTEYTVTFSKNSGSGGTDSVEAVYGLDMPEASAPVRVGYIFGGYFSGSSGSGTQYYDSNMESVNVYDQTQGTTIYAYWIYNN